MTSFKSKSSLFSKTIQKTDIRAVPPYLITIEQYQWRIYEIAI